jgi:tetratricopeptide (TPR) repeat protein
VDKKNDKNKDGIVDYKEAFNVTHSNAKEYEPKLKQYLKTNYRPPKPTPPGIIDRSSIIPKMKCGDSFVPARLGPPKSGEKTTTKKRRRPSRSKKDPGEALMKKAALYESGHDWVTAIDIYKKVSAMGERSRRSKEATRKLDKLLSNKKIKAEYDEANKEKQLAEDLAMAESFILAGRYDEAIEYAEKVINAAPESSQAKKAKILLKGAKEAKSLEK